MLVSRIMHGPVTTITPDTSVRAAAALMGKLSIGALPVCEGGKPVGFITDRDIVVRWVSRINADDTVGPIMTRDLVSCDPDETVEKAAHIMSNAQVRRIVVLDASGEIVGILTLGDIAHYASEELAGQILGEIVERRDRY